MGVGGVWRIGEAPLRVGRAHLIRFRSVPLRHKLDYRYFPEKPNFCPTSRPPMIMLLPSGKCFLYPFPLLAGPCPWVGRGWTWELLPGIGQAPFL